MFNAVKTVVVVLVMLFVAFHVVVRLCGYRFCY